MCVISAIVGSLLASLAAQSNTRRLTTIEAIRHYPGYYHLQNVLLRGELVENGPRIMLRAEDGELRAVLKDGSGRSGPVEVRGQVVDIGKLQPDDPRAVGLTDQRDADHWPKPGEEIVVNVTTVAEAQPAATPSIRALALEPWKFEGQMVTLTGNFRGRNLFGDVPDDPAKGRYDFVLRGAEGAIWVTGMRPRGKGFDLDVDRRIDTDKWLQVNGMVSRVRGLVLVSATQIALAKAPDATEPPEEAAAPPVQMPPAEVVFSSPTPDEGEVSPATTIRIQFSRGLQEPSLAGHLRISYVGGATAAPIEQFKTTYDAASRAIEIRFAQPLERFRSVKVETLEGLKAFDGAPVTPYSFTFSIGG
jgi:hypothetical protein